MLVPQLRKIKGEDFSSFNCVPVCEANFSWTSNLHPLQANTGRLRCQWRQVFAMQMDHHYPFHVFLVCSSCIVHSLLRCQKGDCNVALNNQLQWLTTELWLTALLTYPPALVKTARQLPSGVDDFPLIGWTNGLSTLSLCNAGLIPAYLTTDTVGEDFHVALLKFKAAKCRLACLAHHPSCLFQSLKTSRMIIWEWKPTWIVVLSVLVLCSSKTFIAKWVMQEVWQGQLEIWSCWTPLCASPTARQMPRGRLRHLCRVMWMSTWASTFPVSGLACLAPWAGTMASAQR